jgi:hypothetical protein
MGLLLASVAAHAATSLRVDDKVLTVGDTAARVQELMGQPTVRTYLHRQDGGLPDAQVSRGEQWQYAQDGKTIVITIIDGKVADFETQYH